MLRFACIFFVLLTLSAQAKNLSPWFGNEGQQAFQVDVDDSSVTPDAADGITTGSTAPAACPVEGCPERVNAANTAKGKGGIPQY